MYKPIPMEEKFQKTSNSVFLGPKVLLFGLKNVSRPWTGNELAADDVENCENSQLTLAISCNFVSMCVEILLK